MGSTERQARLFPRRRRPVAHGHCHEKLREWNVVLPKSGRDESLGLPRQRRHGRLGLRFVLGQDTGMGAAVHPDDVHEIRGVPGGENHIHVRHVENIKHID